jgi:hypothetical protein
MTEALPAPENTPSTAGADAERARVREAVAVVAQELTPVPLLYPVTMPTIADVLRLQARSLMGNRKQRVDTLAAVRRVLLELDARGPGAALNDIWSTSELPAEARRIAELSGDPVSALMSLAFAAQQKGQTPLIGRLVGIGKLRHFGRAAPGVNDNGRETSMPYTFEFVLGDHCTQVKVVCWNAQALKFHSVLRRAGVGAAIAVHGYRLKIEVRDEASGKIATAYHPLQVVADPSMAAVGD